MLLMMRMKRMEMPSPKVPTTRVSPVRIVRGSSHVLIWIDVEEGESGVIAGDDDDDDDDEE